MVRSLQGKFPFPQMDWRFNEFPNEGAHALHCTCVEIMGLPMPSYRALPFPGAVPPATKARLFRATLRSVLPLLPSRGELSEHGNAIPARAIDFFVQESSRFGEPSRGRASGGAKHSWPRDGADPLSEQAGGPAALQDRVEARRLTRVIIAVAHAAASRGCPTGRRRAPSERHHRCAPRALSRAPTTS